MVKDCVQFLLKAFFGVLFQIQKQDKNSFDFDEVMKLYADGGFSGLFAKIRIWDSPLVLLEELVPAEGKIVDLGCGDGLVANYLALKAPKRQIIGVDKNEIRLKEADRGLSNTKFVCGDVLSEKIPLSDTVLMIHLLHHLSSFDEQKIVLQKAKGKLKKGGRLIIAEIDHRPVLKYLLTLLVDRIIFPILFEGKNFSAIFYRGRGEWRKLLEGLGFEVKVITAHEGKPFSHVILVGDKC